MLQAGPAPGLSPPVDSGLLGRGPERGPEGSRPSGTPGATAAPRRTHPGDHRLERDKRMEQEERERIASREAQLMRARHEARQNAIERDQERRRCEQEERSAAGAWHSDPPVEPEHGGRWRAEGAWLPCRRRAAASRRRGGST